MPWNLRFTALSHFFLFALTCAAGQASQPLGNWPGWRGDGSGIAPDSSNLPTRWDSHTNIAWNTAIPDSGNSSPVIWGDKVFLTCFGEQGKKRSILCLNLRDGRILWRTDIAADLIQPTEPKNGYASSTCATDGERVYAFFDSPGLVAVSTSDGAIVWRRNLGPFVTQWGMVCSPVLVDDAIVVACDQEKGAFIASFDCRVGTERWRTPRDDRMQFSVPRFISRQGRPQIVLNGRNVIAYSPADGKPLWTCRGMKDCCVPTALYADDLIWVTSGRNGPAMAIDPAGNGDVSDTHVSHAPQQRRLLCNLTAYSGSPTFIARR